MATQSPEEITQLMQRFVGLSVDEQRALYDTLSPAEQAAMDDRGLKRMWRSRGVSEAHGRRVSKAMQRALDDAQAKKARSVDN